MSGTICFIANYTKTIFFREVARELQRHGIKVCWITVDQRYYDLLAKEYDSSALLHIGKHFRNKPAAPVGEFKLNELVLTDRVLRENQDWAHAYLINIQAPMYAFLKANNVRFLIGELTWAHELLLYRMVQQLRELECRFLNPHTIRIPNGRFGFFIDEFQSQLLPRPAAIEDQQTGLQKDFGLVKPFYLATNNKILKERNSLAGLVRRTLAFFANKHHDDLNDPTRPKKWVTVRNRLMEQLRMYGYRWGVERAPFATYADQQFVVYSLHKQPEASIDVMGRYYEDQFQNIVNIWRLLPEGWFLLVKEHTNAIGDRPPTFYHKLRAFRNLVFIHEKEDMAQMVRHAQAVFTVSGTVGIEAMMQGKTAFSFARNFFNGYGRSYHVTLEDLKRCANFQDLCRRVAARNEGAATVEDYKAFVLDHSFDGLIGDVMHTPQAMEPQNILHVTQAFLQVVGTMKQKA